jgi:hypothetical protein
MIPKKYLNIVMQLYDIEPMEGLYYYIFYLMPFIYLFSNSVNLFMLFSSMIVIHDDDELEKHITLKEEIKPPVEVPYPDKYLEKFKSMPFDNESLDVESLKNSIVVEHTPLGNVAMYYDNKREAFVYYSDSVMPYRYLEVVARKYVITFHCKRVFINMEDEINKAKMKIEEQKNAKKLEKEEKEQAEKQKQELELKEEPKKKNVFASFKTYNTNTTKDSSNKPTTGNSNATTTDNKNAEDLILKENANHYTCDGRYSNFLVLKKVDKTLVDKRLKMSFADFKKMQAKKTSS